MTSPIGTGSRKVISSIATVTARPPACRMAASAAAVSTRRMITPPWTLPAMLASVTSIICVNVTVESVTRFGARVGSLTRASYPRLPRRRPARR